MSNAAFCKRRKHTDNIQCTDSESAFIGQVCVHKEFECGFYVALSVLTRGYKSNSQDDRGRHSTYSTTFVYCTYGQARERGVGISISKAAADSMQCFCKQQTIQIVQRNKCWVGYAQRWNKYSDLLISSKPLPALLFSWLPVRFAVNNPLRPLCVSTLTQILCFFLEADLFVSFTRSSRNW